MSFSIIDMVNLFGEKGVKFFSTDAGYTVQHACNDLTLVQEVWRLEGSLLSTITCQCTGLE
jgi:hypothetical protein